MSPLLARGRLLIGRTLGAGALALGDYGAVRETADVDAVLQSAEPLTMGAQRMLLRPTRLAREFAEADISPTFRVNGTQAPDAEAYAALRENGFADWKLKIDGLVNRPLEFSLADLKNCRRVPRSRATIASRAGARSANGRASRTASSFRRQG